MNMYILFDIGSYLEPIIGKLRFITVYLVTGVFGGLLSQIWYVSSSTIIVEAGASGAVFGIIGAFFALITTRLFQEELRSALLTRVGGLIVINIFYGFQAHVNMAAHLGGLISGCVIGYGLYFLMVYKPDTKVLKWVTTSSLVLIALASTSGILTSLKKHDFLQFHAIASDYQALEKSIYGLISMIPANNQAALAYMQTNILPKWEEALTLATRAKELKVVQDQEKFRDYLVQWITLNHKKYVLVAEELKTASFMTQMEIQSIDEKLAKLNKSIQGS